MPCWVRRSGPADLQRSDDARCRRRRSGARDVAALSPCSVLATALCVRRRRRAACLRAEVTWRLRRRVAGLAWAHDDAARPRASVSIGGDASVEGITLAGSTVDRPSADDRLRVAGSPGARDRDPGSRSRVQRRTSSCNAPWLRIPSASATGLHAHHCTSTRTRPVQPSHPTAWRHLTACASLALRAGDRRASRGRSRRDRSVLRQRPSSALSIPATADGDDDARHVGGSSRRADSAGRGQSETNDTCICSAMRIRCWSGSSRPAG